MLMLMQPDFSAKRPTYLIRKFGFPGTSASARLLCGAWGAFGFKGT